MKTTVEINGQLVEEVVRLSGKHTKVAAVEAALEEYARTRSKELLLELPGSIRLENNWRKLRKAELEE